MRWAVVAVLCVTCGKPDEPLPAPPVPELPPGRLGDAGLFVTQNVMYLLEETRRDPIRAMVIADADLERTCSDPSSIRPWLAKRKGVVSRTDPEVHLADFERCFTIPWATVRKDSPEQNLKVFPGCELGGGRIEVIVRTKTGGYVIRFDAVVLAGKAGLASLPRCTAF